MKMQTLAQIRNGVLTKLKKKRKLGLSSLGDPDLRLVKHIDKKMKAECNKEKFNKKDKRKGFPIESYQKRNHEGCQGDQDLCSSSKRKRESEGSRSVCLKRRKKQKKKKMEDKVVPDETARLQRRVKYLLVRMKLEQNLIDAYLGEGWKGQSREKIKPEKELQRAKNQILKCKLGMRDTIHQLDSLGSAGQIDHRLIDPDGSVHHEHIICKKCKSQEISEDNDIILCDGTCNCAFHQKCIDPPLATKDIPPQDEGWLCKYCDCKMEILEAINAHLGTHFSAYSTWQDIFKEEARLSNDGTSVCNLDEEWPDDESDDNDYDPDRDENDRSNRFSMEESDVHEETSTSGSCCSLESEVLSGLSDGRHQVSTNGLSLDQGLVSGYNDNEITSGPRKRCSVDYRKLYDEMFGKDTTTGDLYSEDEDWDPSRRRRRDKENDVANTLMALSESEVKHPDPETLGVENSNLSHQNDRKTLSRIPIDVVQRLRQAFSENELPSKDVKRKISEEVGLEYKKVNKWFKNARYMALKTKKQRENAIQCYPEISNSSVDKATEVIVRKHPQMPISTHKNKRLKKVNWKTSLATLIGPSKRQKLKKTSLGNTQVNVELSDDISLKKHLLQLKTRSKHSKTAQQNTEQNAEKQLEHLCSIQEKLLKLKQVLSNIEKALSDKTDSPRPTEEVVYVPYAELKENV